MSAESAQKFEALEAQASALLEYFVKAGYEPVAPSIIQPASIFLDRIGEALRNRTYVFTDPDGEELCLRPDLTIPSSRLYLERHPEGRTKAKYCYNGPAFRFQAHTGDDDQPREFRQAGIENFGAGDPCKSDAEILSLVAGALENSGIENLHLKIGDLGLFYALLDALEIPERWKNRLKHHYWRPETFQGLMLQLQDPAKYVDQGMAGDLISRLSIDEPVAAREAVTEFLDSNDIPHIGERSIDEITARLLEKSQDLKAYPVPKETTDLIANYLAISGPPKAAAARIADLANANDLDLSAALDTFKKRNEALTKAGINLAEAHFSAEYGRNLEYYTGFVFQLELTELGVAGQIAGGGRYDGLLTDIGAPRAVPAIGSAIHTERLLDIVGQRSES